MLYFDVPTVLCNSILWTKSYYFTIYHFKEYILHKNHHRDLECCHLCGSKCFTLYVCHYKNMYFMCFNYLMQMLDCLMTCLIEDPQSFSRWQQMYTNHMVQTRWVIPTAAQLVFHAVNVWLVVFSFCMDYCNSSVMILSKTCYHHFNSLHLFPVLSCC